MRPRRRAGAFLCAVPAANRVIAERTAQPYDPIFPIHSPHRGERAADERGAGAQHIFHHLSAPVWRKRRERGHIRHFLHAAQRAVRPGIRGGSLRSERFAGLFDQAHGRVHAAHHIHRRAGRRAARMALFRLPQGPARSGARGHHRAFRAAAPRRAIRPVLFPRGRPREPVHGRGNRGSRANARAQPRLGRARRRNQGSCRQPGNLPHAYHRRPVPVRR